jgi:AraC-like DNA-binding protein
MELFFDLSSKHRIMNAAAPNYPTPIMHPNRILDEHDLIYIRKGAWEIGQEDETFLAREGDVLILSAGRPHYGVTPCHAGTGTMYIHALSSPADRSGEPFPTSGDGVYLRTYIPTRGDIHVRSCFEQVIYAVARHDGALASAYFDALLLELQRHMQHSEDKQLAEQITEMISLSDHMLSNGEIAHALGCSVKSCEVAFKKTYGTTIHRHVLESRVQQAKFYLINFPDMKLAELSRLLGFYDEFHLSRHFKRICGVAPSEFRQQLRGG